MAVLRPVMVEAYNFSTQKHCTAPYAFRKNCGVKHSPVDENRLTLSAIVLYEVRMKDESAVSTLSVLTSTTREHSYFVTTAVFCCDHVYQLHRCR